MNITLIIPCYNEVANLQKGFLDKIGNYVEKDDQFSEVLIVDDGSSDDSREIVRKYFKRFPKFKLIENNHQGKAFAIITGIKEASGDQVMFSDIDLATPIEESQKLISAYEQGNQIVIGSRGAARAGAPLTRKIMALGMITLRGIFLGLGTLRDTQCGFKLFETKAARATINRLRVFKNGKTIQGSSVSAGFDLEFLFVAKKMKFSIAEVPVTWRHVETKNVHFINDSLETLSDMLKIRSFHIQGKYNFNEK